MNIIKNIIPRSNLWALQSSTKYNWYVYPIGRDSKIPLAGTHGKNSATNIASEIVKWYAKDCRMNFGYNLDMSGLSVIDVDTHGANGYKALDVLLNMKLVTINQLESSLIQLTPSGGMHFIFRTERPFKTCQIGRYVETLKGIDLLNKGHSVICAGSTVNGKSYSLVNSIPNLEEIGYFPSRLIDYLDNVRPEYKITKYATERSKVDIELPMYIDGTGRNNWLASCAGKLISCVEVQSVNDLHNELMWLNNSLSRRLGSYEVMCIAKSIFRYKI